VRIHRSALVNLSRVKGLQRWMAGSYGVLLEDGTELRMSRSGLRKLEGALGQPI
jgi:DNA-binding LytR/AlgR family response regulator